MIAPQRAFRAMTSLLAMLLMTATAVAGPPDGFVDEQVLSGIESPAGFKFAPDGRLFFSERVAGRLRTATYAAGSDTWQVDPQPYATFGTPVDAGGAPSAHRSSGLRDFAFDPNFAVNGHVYVFYMRHNPRHNRVARIQQDPNNASRALPGETVLLDLPFNASSSSGSHNGGAVDFGADGCLYVTTGDGWNGGDGVQSLGTYTGKVYRIHPDGSIPTDNPFYGQASGPLRAIYCLGLRNPYAMCFNESSGHLYVLEANGSTKTDILRVAPGANFGHQGYGGLGIDSGPWHVSSISGGSADKLITGGAWYDGSAGTLPAGYVGSLFVCHWGSNGSGSGVINTVASEQDLTTTRFADDVLKPVNIRIGPDGHIYYMYTTYDTSNGRIHRVRYTGAATAAAPEFAPAPGTYVGLVSVELASATPGAAIHYTLDGSAPDESSTLYDAPLPLTATATVRARAYADGFAASAITEGVFTVCPDSSCNLPPVASAGADRTVVAGRQAYLSGSASSDPDTDELLLVDGWRQVAGVPVVLLNDDETVAYFTPTEPGWYTFEYEVSDELSTSYDTVDVFVVPCLDVDLDGLIATWRFDEGVGDTALETAGGFHHGVLDGAVWGTARSVDAGGAVALDGIDDAVDLGFLDIDSDAVTFSAWVRFDDFDQLDGRILSKADGVQDADHWWMLSSIASGGDHVLRFRLKTVGGGTTTLIANGTPLVAGAWTHVAATYDGSTMRIWQDGVSVAATGKTGRVATDPTVPAAIGNQPARSRPFDGLIDDVRILERALSAGEIAALAAFYRPFDVDQSGMVDGEDYVAYVSSPRDLNGDGLIDVDDEMCLLAYLLCGIDPATYFGCLGGPGQALVGACVGRDLDGDFDCDLADVLVLQQRAGEACP